MKISAGLEITDTALWIPEKRVLIMNDLHIGYEEALLKRGVLIPKFQLPEMIEKASRIIKETRPRIIILNGDVKHEFGTILRQEWKGVLQFLDFLLARCEEIIIIKGNHDPILQTIVEKRRIKVVKGYALDYLLVVHGDEIVETDAKKIIIGHEHPAITLRQGSKWEKYKCFLKGKWQGKEVIAVPSFNPLLEGTDILKEEVLSPFLEDILNFDVFVVGKDEIFSFGKVKDVKKL